MRVDLKKRVIAAVILGVAWAHFAHADAPVAIRATLTQNGVHASMTGVSGTGASEWRGR